MEIQLFSPDFCLLASPLEKEEEDFEKTPFYGANCKGSVEGEDGSVCFPLFSSFSSFKLETLISLLHFRHTNGLSARKWNAEASVMVQTFVRSHK